jgi:hypothetical protein
MDVDASTKKMYIGKIIHLKPGEKNLKL